VEHELLERSPALRHDEQATGRPPGDERLFDRASSGNELLVRAERFRRRQGDVPWRTPVAVLERPCVRPRRATRSTATGATTVGTEATGSVIAGALGSGIVPGRAVVALVVGTRSVVALVGPWSVVPGPAWPWSARALTPVWWPREGSSVVRWT
jgi:hypothetical protein